MVIVSISNTASMITLALPKSDNNNNNNNNNIDYTKHFISYITELFVYNLYMNIIIYSTI